MRLSIEGHILLLSIWNPRIPQGAWSGVGAGAAAVATGLMATASSVYWCGAWESSFTQWKRKGFLYQIYRITRDFYFPTSPSSLPLTNLCVHPWTNSWWTVASHFMTDSWTFAGIWDGFQPHQVDLWETAVSGSEKKILVPCPGIEFGQLVAQMVKKLPVMLETWVWPLGQEDVLQKGRVTHSSILPWRIP